MLSWHLRWTLMVAAAATSMAVDCSLPIDAAAGSCGNGYRCEATQCCSKYGYCGTDSSYCAVEAGCQSNFGSCGTTKSTCTKATPTSTTLRTASAKRSNLSKCPKKPGLIGNYYTTWNPPNSLPDSDLLFYFAAVTTENGFTFTSSETAALPAFVQAARKKGSKAIVTIGGWGGSIYFSSLVSSTASQKRLASQIKDFIDQYDLDGVDLDWEYPNSQGAGCNRFQATDTTKYLAFLQQLRKAVGTKLILAAVPIAGFTGSSGSPLSDARAFAAIFDYITIMNYDVYGTWSSTTGPNAPLYSTCSTEKSSAADAVAYWTKAGFKACRILLGVPSYGTAFTTINSLLSPTVVGSHTSYLYQEKTDVAPKGDSTDELGSGTDACGNATGGSYAGSWTYESILSEGLLSKDGKTGQAGFTRYYDSCSQTPFLFNKAQKYLITYDDTESLAAKARFAKTNGLAGVNVFHSKGLPASVYRAMRQHL